MAGVDVVVDHQNLRTHKLGTRAINHALTGHLEVKGHHELGALAQLAFDLDATVHHINDVLRDGHPQARALNAAHRGSVLAREVVEDVVDELGRHTDAVVLHVEHVGHVIFEGARLFGYADDDVAVVRGVLDRVAHDVDQNLVEAQLIGDHVLVQNILRIDVKMLMLGDDLALDQDAQVVQHFGHVHHALFKLNSTTLDTAHVQDLVDKAQQMLARSMDLAQVVLNLLRFLDMRLRQRGEAYDGVQGRADVMTHVA